MYTPRAGTADEARSLLREVIHNPAKYRARRWIPTTPASGETLNTLPEYRERRSNRALQSKERRRWHPDQWPQIRAKSLGHRVSQPVNPNNMPFGQPSFGPGHSFQGNGTK